MPDSFMPSWEHPMPEGRASTGSEPRRFRLSREPDDGRIVAYQHAGDRLDYGHILEVQEVVERDHDEGAEEAFATLRREREFHGEDLRAARADERERTLKAVVEEFANVAWIQPVTVKADAIREAMKIVAERFNLTEGQDDG